MNNNVKPSALEQAWARLEEVCRKLWDTNSPCAVETQAIVEEFKGEVHRLDSHMSNIDDLRAHDRREHEEDLAGMRREYEMELASLKKRLELDQKAMNDKDARFDELLKTLARKEEENLEFHSQVLRMSATSDESKSKKMEEFYQELLKKEAALADSWQKRHQTLESEHKHLEQILAARQTELDAWENRRVSEEESLKRRTTDVEIKTQQLAQEYRKKQQEIEELKANLQTSITDLVRQYQSRLRNPTTPAPGSR
jgi:chromosome segregation ATPase